MSYDKSIPSKYDSIFQKAADTHGVSYDLLRKISYNESRFDPNARSKTGPLGIMQFTKGTAKALGLKVTGGADDGRLNPELAIDAAARHLSDLTRKYNGDELKAALAYNQGEGARGAAQIAAYDKGDWASISHEGRNYMRNLMDVAKSDRKGSLEAFGGITPKAKTVSVDEGLGGITRSGKVGTELPESTGFTIKGKEQEAPATSFAKDFWQTHGTTVEEYENRSTFFGIGDASKAELHNSVLGVAFNAARHDNSWDVFVDNIKPTKWNSYTPTKEDLQKLRDSGLPASYYHVVTGGDAETWDDLIKIAKENYEYDKKAADAGTGAKLASGIIGAAVDPLTYVPVAGVAGKGIKVVNKALIGGAQAAVTNVASEGIRTSIAGGEAHYSDAVVGGLLFGAGMSLAHDGFSALSRRSGGEDLANPFSAPSIRLEARESALNAGTEDLTRLPTEGRDFDGYHNGVAYADHPTEEGAAVLANGAIMSPTNPANPKLLKEFSEVDPERAAKGITSGGFTEIGYTLLRSEDKNIRGIASDLVRSPTGTEAGTNGKFGATSSDIHERLHNSDQRAYNQMYNAARKAMDDPRYSYGEFKMSREAAMQDVYKRVALAIERPELQADLSKADKELLNIIKNHFDVKREMMENPAMFGDPRAVGFFPNSRHVGTYVPHVYDNAARAMMLERYGADGLREGIARSWMVSYRSRPEVRTRVEEGLKESLGVEEVTEEMVAKYAMDKAYGISHTEEFTGASVLEDNIDGLSGIENNKFLEARNLFDSDMPITMPDGQMFSVNDLRNFDMSTVMPAYDRRINGDIAIMGGTGKTTAELKELIESLSKSAKGDGKKLAEVKALGETVKILTGRARRDADTPFETMGRALSDLSFFAKNAFMGAQNLTEVAGLLAKGSTEIALNNIPLINSLALRKSVVGVKELKDLHGALFGKELDDLIRPKRADIVQKLRENTDVTNTVANVVGTLKYGTQELAARSPWTKMLNGTSNLILDTARQGVLVDVFNHALAGRKSAFGKDNLLKSASITKEQWEGIKSLIKEHATVDPETGKYSVTNKQAFISDPRAMDLWRMADRFADEVMLRPHKVSSMDTKAYPAAVRLAMQFKNFTIKSLNGRTMRSFYEATKNHRALDQALTAILSGGLAGAFYLFQSHAKAYGLPEQERKEYLKRATSPQMIAFASVARSSHVGAPMGVASLIGGLVGYDPAKDIRTSVLPHGDLNQKTSRDKPLRGADVASSLAGNIGQQIPALGAIGGLSGAVYNAASVLNAPNKPTELDFMTGLMNSTRELVPNDPISQSLVVKLYEEQGVRIKPKH